MSGGVYVRSPNFSIAGASTPVAPAVPTPLYDSPYGPSTKAPLAYMLSGTVGYPSDSWASCQIFGQPLGQAYAIVKPCVCVTQNLAFATRNSVLDKKKPSSFAVCSVQF